MTIAPRRWLRFRLRTVFVLTTLVALWLGWELSIVRKRNAALRELRSDPTVDLFMAADFETVDQPRLPASKLRLLLGEKRVAVITFDSQRDERDIAKAAQNFPEAAVSRRLYAAFDSPGQTPHIQQ